MKKKYGVGSKLRLSALALSVLMLVAVMTACSKKEAVVQDGAIYVTETESFWVGVGSAYISFDYVKEPEEKEKDDTSPYGYVFSVYVSSGKDFEPWLTGTWELEETKDGFGDLSLTASWDTKAENQTKLADTESGVSKVYKPKDGKYEISVAIPSADVTFILDPQTNKVEADSVSSDK